MAEFYMRDYVNKRGRGGDYEIASAATSNEEIGNPVHCGTKKKLAELGISAAGKRARRLTAADGEYYDYIVGMDGRNVRDILRIVGGHGEKVFRLLDVASERRDVADPWYTGDFDATLRDVKIGCEALFKLTENNE